MEQKIVRMHCIYICIQCLGKIKILHGENHRILNQLLLSTKNKKQNKQNQTYIIIIYLTVPHKEVFLVHLKVLIQKHPRDDLNAGRKHTKKKGDEGS